MIEQTQEYKTVEKAAAWLDRLPKFPDNWRDLIDLDTLNIRDTCKCICGQAGGFGELTSSDRAAKFWGTVDRAWAEAIGDDKLARRVFGSWDFETPKEHQPEAWTAIWKAYITNTRTADAADPCKTEAGIDQAAGVINNQPCEVRHRFQRVTISDSREAAIQAPHGREERQGAGV